MKKLKLKKMTEIAGNYSGNAALCAILIMIMLLSIGTAALVVTGRTGIDENDSMPARTVVASSSESEADSTDSVAEEPSKLMVYPEKDAEFQKVDLANVTTKYSVLLECDSNTIFAGRNYSKKIYPASLTKLMTVVVALENCDDLSDTYKFTKDDINKLADENASVAGFKAGEKVTVEDLLYGAILPSGADATLGLANYVAGSEEAFVELMNAKVEELGLTGTHFVNASGLHDDDHYSTPLDLAMIVKYAIENEDISKEFLKIISAENYTTSSTKKHDGGIALTSIFAERYSGFFIDRDEDGEADAEIIGGKTGFTNESKYSLASVYKIDDTYYVCVTVKSPTSGDATNDNVAIAERYLPTYDLITVGDDSSSEVDSSEDSSSVIDATPEPIDQTDSADMIVTATTEETSHIEDDEVPS
jgi:D-alanyl-D-alanine carboxypeptidase (penicillin-binding protein 5/6)